MRNFQGTLNVDGETIAVIGAMGWTGEGDERRETGWFQVPASWRERLADGAATLDVLGGQPRTIATRVTSPASASVMLHVEFEAQPVAATA